MHLTIDGFGGDSERLASEDVLRELLLRYLTELGLKPAVQPHVHRETGDDGDVSGFMVGSGSHVTVHTSAARGQAWVDIFSADDFDATLAITATAAALDLREVTTRLVERAAAESAE
jgi:S-adenosylmethionine/arginine decarboxylase-like enzyme